MAVGLEYRQDFAKAFSKRVPVSKKPDTTLLNDLASGSMCQIYIGLIGKIGIGNLAMRIQTTAYNPFNLSKVIQ